MPAYARYNVAELRQSVVSAVYNVAACENKSLYRPCTAMKITMYMMLMIMIITVKNFHGSLTTVVRAQNDTSKTANITDTIFDTTYWYSPYKRRRFENR